MPCLSCKASATLTTCQQGDKKIINRTTCHGISGNKPLSRTSHGPHMLTTCCCSATRCEPWAPRRLHIWSQANACTKEPIDVDNVSTVPGLHMITSQGFHISSRSIDARDSRQPASRLPGSMHAYTYLFVCEIVCLHSLIVDAEEADHWTLHRADILVSLIHDVSTLYRRCLKLPTQRL